MGASSEEASTSEVEPEPPRDTSEDCWIDCSPNGDRGVLRRIIKPGNTASGHPIDGWCAKVNYDAYIEGGWFHGRRVDTTRDRAEEDGDYQFLLGDKHEAVKDGWVLRGLNYGCLKMHRGERSELIVAPEYAYGAAGNKARPKVPPNATLRIVVDMLTWKPALSDEKNMLDMPWSERLELAHATKESANEHFREGQPEEARERYWKAGMLMDVIGNPGTEVEMPAEKMEEQNALAVTCWLNEAMCYVKMAQNEEESGTNYRGRQTTSTTNPTLWRKAIASCDTALRLDPNSVKGHYRKGLALLHLHEFDAAREHFEAARKGNPASKEIRQAIERLRQEKAEAEAEDKAMFVKVLKKSKGLYSGPVDHADTAGVKASAASKKAAVRRVKEIELVNPKVFLDFTIGDEARRRHSTRCAHSRPCLLTLSLSLSLPLALLRDRCANASRIACCVQAAGRVVLELWSDQLPKTSENFRQLCTGEKGMHVLTRRPLHYKGSPIHRVVGGMMIQGGDIVRGDGVGGASIYGSFFADEGFETKHTDAGLLCMANQGLDTNRSQFYITTAACPHLDGRHVVFGKVRAPRRLLLLCSIRATSVLWALRCSPANFPHAALGVPAQVISGMETVRRIEASPVVDEKPSVAITISDCGEVAQ